MLIKNLPVSWHGNKKAWITSSILTEWVAQLNKQRKQRKIKILLFIDNCPAYPSDLSFSNVKVQFLLAKTTSHLQLLDQGIIQVFKLLYRKFLLQTIISRTKECKSANEIASYINVLNAKIRVNDLWNLVCQSTISKCFERCGFLKQIFDDTIIDSQFANDDNGLIQNLKNHLNFENEPVNAELFMNFDSNIPTCNTSVDQESLKPHICNMFKNEKESEEDCVSEDEIEENDEISVAEILKMCEKMKMHAINICLPMLDLVRKLEDAFKFLKLCLFNINYVKFLNYVFLKTIVERKCFKQ